YVDAGRRTGERPRPRQLRTATVGGTVASARGFAVVAGDVVVHQLAELGGELFGRALQGGELLAVDVNRAVGRLAGARQADADVGRLAFAGAVDHAAHHRQ